MGRRAELTKKEQLEKAFRDILGNEVVEFTIGSNVDNVAKLLIREVTIRTNLK